MFMMTLFEARYQNCDDWHQITELELIDCLHKYYKKVTPAIQQMINGEEIFTPEAIYRMKLNGLPTKK